MFCPSCREVKGVQDIEPHCNWEAVQALLPHWASLDDDKRKMYAQMAVVTRQVHPGRSRK